MCIFAITQAQYILIHQALLEHNQFGETEIPLSELHSTLNTLRSKVPPSDVSLMVEEFEVLSLFIIEMVRYKRGWGRYRLGG